MALGLKLVHHLTFLKYFYYFFRIFTFTHYNHNGPPNDRRPSCGTGGDSYGGWGLHPPRSYHPGIVHVLFGDGHIEAIADSIQPATWSALGTHNAGD